jgi:hypothetical protein
MEVSRFHDSRAGAQTQKMLHVVGRYVWVSSESEMLLRSSDDEERAADASSV